MADSDLAMQCEAQGKMIEQLKTLIREREETIKAKDKELQVSFSALPFCWQVILSPKGMILPGIHLLWAIFYDFSKLYQTPVVSDLIELICI